MMDNVYDYIYIEIMKDNIDNLNIVVENCWEKKRLVIFIEFWLDLEVM